MILNFDERLSDSPFVERIWRTQSKQASSFTSLALSHWQLCVWTENGNTNVTMRGPETKATRVPCPANAEFLGPIGHDARKRQLHESRVIASNGAGHVFNKDA